jgi:hypothetical protein
MNMFFLIGEGAVLLGPDQTGLQVSGVGDEVGVMALSDVLTRLLGFLRAGYPEGVPTNDYIPLMALLRRRLSDDEVVALASELMSTGHAPVEGTDARVAITKITDEMPSQQDTERVRQRLVAAGWPVSESWGSSE